MDNVLRDWWDAEYNRQKSFAEVYTFESHTQKHNEIRRITNANVNYPRRDRNTVDMILRSWKCVACAAVLVSLPKVTVEYETIAWWSSYKR